MSELVRGLVVRRFCSVLLAIALLPLPAWARSAAETPAQGSAREVAIWELPPEARYTIVLIRRGGPFPYERDGAVFANFERALPAHGRGYYREYTVPTPGIRSRGARRIIAARDSELYYTDDHYRTFRRIRE